MHLRMSNAQRLLFTGITGLQEKPNPVNPALWHFRHSSLKSCCFGGFVCGFEVSKYLTELGQLALSYSLSLDVGSKSNIIKHCLSHTLG